MTYIEYVLNYIEEQECGEPIYTERIAEGMAADFGIPKKKAAAAISVAVSRVMEGEKRPDLRCYQKGIYYRTVATPFGEMGINREKLIANKYLIPDKGYETGLRLLHYMGLTTQMPAECLVATNAARDCVRYDAKLDVSICPPKVPVNADNKAYLQILDALDLMEKAPVDAENPYELIAGHIFRNHLQYETLLYFADRYYNRRTILSLAHTAGLKGVAF